MGPRDQEAWECRSRLARTLIMRRCAANLSRGIWAWARMMLLCALCLLGLWGHHITLLRCVCGPRTGALACQRHLTLPPQHAWLRCSWRGAGPLLAGHWRVWLGIHTCCLVRCALVLCRPAIERHAAARAERRRQAALQRTQAALLKMRTNAAAGRQALDGGGGDLDSANDADPPDPGAAAGAVGGGGGGVATKKQGMQSDEGGGGLGSSSGSGGEQPQQSPVGNGSGSFGGRGGGAVLVEEDVDPGHIGSARADRAFTCYSQAVELLLLLSLQQGSLPQGFIEAEASQATDNPHFHVYEEEQAATYCGWAEAALAKFRACSCAGCAVLAAHTLSAAHRQVARLFGRCTAQCQQRQLQQRQAQQRGGGGGGGGAAAAARDEPQQERWRRVGTSLAKLAHLHARLLLQTDVKQSGGPAPSAPLPRLPADLQ